MSFDWMEPTSVERDGAPVLKQKFVEEFRQRAELLRRLGYTKTQTLARCKSRMAWEYDFQGDSPISDREMGALVKGVYGE
ncbi:MAG: hypothetical protein VX519_00800 [Myxococcota bacterium]|nr:hypothetical protein [Myxococcota bacterium]